MATSLTAGSKWRTGGEKRWHAGIFCLFGFSCSHPSPSERHSSKLMLHNFRFSSQWGSCHLEDLIQSRRIGCSRKLLPECVGQYCYIKIYEDLLLLAFTCLVKDLLSRCNKNIDKARRKSAGAAHAGDWLNAAPIPSLGLRLSDEAITVAVRHRLRSNTRHPIHACMSPKLTLEVYTALHARRVDRETSAMLWSTT